MNGRTIGISAVGCGVLLLAAVLTIPMLVLGGTSMLFAGSSGTNCGSSSSTVTQPGVSTAAADSIPSNYLHWFQVVGAQYNVPWTILAGIGKVESDDGRTTLPGVDSGSNAFGAAGPMQIGIGGASTNTWGGAPVHPASEVVDGVATDEDGGADANVYDPADAIAGAAKYLTEHGVQQDPEQAIFAYNHADWYVAEVLSWANTYASGGFTVTDSVTPNGSNGGSQGAGVSGGPVAGDTADGSTACTETSVLESFVAPNSTVANAVNYAEEQLGKPYLDGATGPGAFDSAGLVMMAYRAAGVTIPGTAQQQWKSLPHVASAHAEAGDLVFFVGDGTKKDPGHVGLVIGKNTMIEAYGPGTTIRVATFGTPQSPVGDTTVVGYAQPWPAAKPATPPTPPKSPS